MTSDPKLLNSTAVLPEAPVTFEMPDNKTGGVHRTLIMKSNPEHVKVTADEILRRSDLSEAGRRQVLERLAGKLTTEDLFPEKFMDAANDLLTVNTPGMVDLTISPEGDQPAGASKIKKTVSIDTAERIVKMLNDASIGNDRKASLIKEAFRQAESKYPEQQSLLLELFEWRQGGFRLERPTGSHLHKIHEAFKSNNVIGLIKTMAGLDGRLGSALQNGLSAHAFVIGHDWAAAFASAQDFEGGEFNLPYDSVAFEFRVSGRNVIAMLGGTGSDNTGAIFVQAGDYWLLPKYMYRSTGHSFEPISPVAGKSDLTVTDPDEFSELKELVYRQIRAVCISLEAEVATTEVVRAPYKLNRAREKSGKPPLVDYHIVSLARRSRLSALPDNHIPGERRGPRLHFVRGHFRHYENHKAWIKWHLRGDQDLGFIDKEYRL